MYVLSYLKNVERLEPELSKKGIECKTTFNINGLSGVSFRYNQQAYKGSQIGIKAKDIIKAIKDNQILELKKHITSLNAFYKNIQNALKAILNDYENGKPSPDFKLHFQKNEIKLEDENLFYKGYRISNKPLIQFRKSAETYVLGTIKDFEFKTHQYNDLMHQEPEKVPLLFGRDKVLAENKKLLKEQQVGIKPKLLIKINRSSIPDYTKVFIKAIQKHKDKLSVLSETENKIIKTVSNEYYSEVLRGKNDIRRKV